ncbi:DHA2 family multidrug resistance protein-like MFS transporter [Kribbella amoyensis]|uniref:DHA2 family multidrug resistance protein-like MFS transporter n=1 Tax=Kribbella amoyensis TaxID=996641 RepID=A0A561C034_9ACTN|nr:MFS transporter [Kribbella amoyensis]TWD84549.1 DHA2 family multidrug resistance protein-like MFS transporter [Kribbella amoyensis]
MTTDTTASRAAGRREWLGLAVLVLPALLASLELTITHLALPAIGRDLGASSTQLLWIVDGYAFLLAGTLIVMGALGDRIGRRRLLLGGAVAFSVLSVAAAYAPTAEVLVAVRALLGIAGATLMPSVLALTTALFTEPRQRTQAVGIVIAAVSAGTAIGPLVGGWLLDHFWWGSAFLLPIPLMLVLVVVGPATLPECKAPTGRRLDLPSAALSIAAVLAIVYGLKQVAAAGSDPSAFAAIVAGVVCATIFIRRQRRLADPLVDLGLFTRPEFTTATVTLLLGIFVLWGTNYAVAQYLQLVAGLDPLTAGLWTAPAALGVIVGSLGATRLARKVSAGRIIGGGLLLSSVGFVIITWIDPATPLPVLTGAMILVSAGLGPTMALATDLMVGSAPAGRAGAASAIASTAPQLGGGLGIAILGSIITAGYRAKMQGTTSPADDNLTAAVATAAHLPATEAAALLTAARSAYTEAFALSALAAAALTVLTGISVLLILRRR